VQVAATESGTGSRRRKKMASQLPSELSFYRGSQTDALSSTVLPKSSPPLGAKTAAGEERHPASNKKTTPRAMATTDDINPVSSQKREYSPRGAKLSALVALVDTIRSPTAGQHQQKSPAFGGKSLVLFLKNKVLL
jgi:hypothetical protein